jgi:hypothetical protein
VIHVLVSAAKKKYAVPTRIIHLYDGVAIRLIRNSYPTRVDARRFQLPDKEGALGAHLPRVGDIGARPGEGEALVEPLPSREYGQGLSRFRLSGF